MSDLPVRPKHYRESYYQPIDVISAWCLTFALGNVLKYICRAGKKESASRREDLLKALWYMVYEISNDSDIADVTVNRVASDLPIS